MSLAGVRPLPLEQNADMVPIVWTWYPNATSQTSLGTAQDLTTYTCSMMVRVSPEDTGAPVATYTPSLGGVAGTITLNLSHAQINTLFPLLPYNSTNGAYGWYDIILTSAGNVITKLTDPSPLTIKPAVTR